MIFKFETKVFTTKTVHKLACKVKNLKNNNCYFLYLSRTGVLLDKILTPENWQGWNMQNMKWKGRMKS